MSDASAEDPLVGKTLVGRFKILEPLGVGGMGKVYKALQSPLDRVVALKVLNPRYNGTKDPGFERRFFLEAAMTAKLHHPNTITVHDYGRTDDGIFFIAMEYLEGETLAAVLNKTGPLPWPRALNICSQVARSLREAHKMGIIHRDLKPANVMVLQEETGTDMVKVLDFGLVKSFMPEMNTHDVELTQAGVLLGSPLYMAPEQARGEADPRADIYALGVLLFQLLSGKPPFGGKDSIDIIVKHIKEKPPRIHTMVADLPWQVSDLVMKCLEKEPSARFQSMDEFLEALRQAAIDGGLSGAFSDPRSLVVSAPREADVRATPTPVSRSRGGSDTRSMRSIEVDVPISAEEFQERSKKNLVIPIALGVAAASVLVILVLVMTGKPKQPADETPQPVRPPKVVKNVAPPVDPDPRPVEPVKPTGPVVFEVKSTPAGATVTMDGQQVGITPFSLPLERGDDAMAKAELVFSLDGYEKATLQAQGEGAQVSVSASLKKKASGGTGTKKKPPKDDHPPGYKDDPYQ